MNNKPADWTPWMTVVAKVNVRAVLEENETLDDYKKRVVDIYLHSFNSNHHFTKEDVGADQWTIGQVGVDDSLIVPTKLFVALIETAKRSTDLSGVYGDDDETYFSWEEVNKFLEGFI